jgi:uncharacterized sporulation protein YeaH/YhbH (DUF444 family)
MTEGNASAMDIIDRRLNPKGKSLGNRHRFIQRARTQIRDAIRDNLRARSIADAESGEKVSIARDGVYEPRFVHDPSTGRRAVVLPGNKEFVEGDHIARPSGGGGRGGRASADGEGEDDFVFKLTREEFLDLFFDDLELPDLVMQSIKVEKAPAPQRAGYSLTGPHNRLNLIHTLRRSQARRTALGRASPYAVEQVERELKALRDGDTQPAQGISRASRIAELEAYLTRADRKRGAIPYVDPIDLRYRRYERVPQPIAQAVMFCLMDVSASMDEERKNLAKRFFMLLHLFLHRHHEDVDVVFIRHTSEAQEVDEESFFYGRETGGTVVSTALNEMLRILEERYLAADWNIYLAQASDGDDLPNDIPLCVSLLNDRILPLCQYAAYVEVGEPSYGTGFHAHSDSGLWTDYSDLGRKHANFAARRISHPRDIYPVFRGLFARSGQPA